MLVFAPVLTTLLLGPISNALNISFMPTAIRDTWQSGIRERLWASRLGKWIAKRMSAPEQSRAVGGGVFRPTEVGLGAAASLATSVAALESLRMDLLRLHADANSLAPLATLIEAAQRASDDVRRLADARREVDRLGL